MEQEIGKRTFGVWDSVGSFFVSSIIFFLSAILYYFYLIAMALDTSGRKIFFIDDAYRAGIGVTQYSLWIASPFIIYSLLILFLSRKNKSRKMGALIGFIFPIIIFLLVFTAYSPYAAIKNAEPLIFNTQKEKQLNMPFCSGLPDSFQKDGCFRELALEEKDISICDKINHTLSMDSVYFCYIELAKTQNIEFARLRNNSSYCEKIDDNAKTYNNVTKSLCYSSVLKDKDVFQAGKVNGINFATYYFNISEAAKDFVADGRTEVFSKSSAKIKFTDIKVGHQVRIYGSSRGSVTLASIIYDDSLE